MVNTQIREVKKEQKIEFPCLMVLHKGQPEEIILWAVDKDSGGCYKGIALQHGKDNLTGHDSYFTSITGGWSPQFKPLEGELELENDNQDQDFPKLMVVNGRTKDETVIWATSRHNNGYNGIRLYNSRSSDSLMLNVTSNWSPSFRPLKGKLTLSNK